ncbi:LysR substrate-binding domain-containing protein [Bacillota bacterium Lsc_1132]
MGVSSIFARYKLPAILKDFVSHYPDVEIHVKTGWCVEINHKLHKEEVHLARARENYVWPEEKQFIS